MASAKIATQEASIVGWRLIKRWQHLSLAKQFGLASSAVLLIVMTVIGIWVARKIEEGVTQNTAAATALYVNSFVEPKIRELSNSNSLSETGRAALDNLFSSTALGKRVVSFKIWTQDGLIIYSSRKELIGKRFHPTQNLKRAWSGVVSAEFDELVDAEDELERIEGVPLLEVYAPVRSVNSDRIIAVVEFYERADSLQDNLFRAKRQSWLVVSLLTLATIATLFGIVRRGSRTIESQRRALQGRISELSSLLEQNEELRSRVEQAAERAVQTNENFLRRVGTEFHDGPAQLLGLALLRLDAVKSQFTDTSKSSRHQLDDFETIRSVLSEAIAEIRNLCSGLVVPELAKLSLKETLETAVRKHERRTGTKVASEISIPPSVAPMPLKICLYRFVQEALNNAFRHAGGKGQQLRAVFGTSGLEVEVQDAGDGFVKPDIKSSVSGIGLNGMRERVEASGGSLDLRSSASKGTSVAAWFPASVLGASE